jgi:N-sulfoglucosamine sulfohydrolase
MMQVHQLALAAFSLLFALPVMASPAKNVVLYVGDDLGREFVGCYGNPQAQTPGMDALASEGMRFENAFCTTASCSPSRSVLLTGLQNHANGQYGLAHYNFSTREKMRSLPARLSEAGYRTVLAGKFHLAPEAVYPFDVTIPVQTPQKMAERVREHIELDSEQPFFLYFCPVEPHRPFSHGDMPVPPAAEIKVPSWLPDTPEAREEVALNHASARQCDAGLVALIQTLKDTGHWDDTLVILLSDNGAPFPGAKTTHYEPGVRLPCVMRLPGMEKAGTASDALISWCDITPTILEFAEVPIRKGDTHGRSLLPLLKGEASEEPNEVFLSHTFHEVTMYYPMRTLREKRFKMIWNLAHELPFPTAQDLYDSQTWQASLIGEATHYGKRELAAYLQRPEFELYDLESDPDELINLAQSPEHAATLMRMQARLRELQKDTKDPWLLKWDHE